MAMALAATPIKHVIVIVGENRTFDHVFATYQPKGDQTVWNLLSQGIVDQDGAPGPNYAKALQFKAVADAAGGYRMAPGGREPYAHLPAPMTGGPTVPYITTEADAAALGGDLPAEYLRYLMTGGTGLPYGVVDTRLANASSLPAGPFSLHGVGYDAYAQSPVHRFYQMWQQLDCSLAAATDANPSGCRNDLFAWVETSVGAGSNGKPQPTPYDDTTTKEGGTALGFYDIARGDAPYLKELADGFAMSDNFHQSVQGGTGANSIFIGTADMLWFSDGKGQPLTPPALNVENPNPQPGTNNYYTQDGYAGGSYSACADEAQPGVGPIVRYLRGLKVSPSCEAGHYYLLNNYSPGYYGDGTVKTGNFVIPPSSVRTIGDALSEAQLPWRYYAADWDRYVKDSNGTDPLDVYCDICNPFQYASSIMADAAVRNEHLKDTKDFYADVAAGELPAFAIVKPNGLVDGHPASSKLDLFEGFAKKVVDAVRAKPELWADTAIFVTFDEGGGYYDSGYVQPVDFFGDGPRIPLIVVSPHATGGRIGHNYADHASILKFVERNWGLAPLTARSRDNLPNPVASAANPYVPRNAPALDDLFELFDF
jgi:phospholipase C